MRVLGIETSCDETSVALLEVGGVSSGAPMPPGAADVRMVFHETATQIPIHERYGGVVPEVAARTHVAELVSLLERGGVFGHGSASFDAVAATRGPGLATALRVGLEAGKILAWVSGKPMVGVNHLEGHLASAWLDPANRDKWRLPLLAVLVSGGHSEYVLMRDFGRYRVLGRTRDDAAGEAFDKAAKLMGLGYPGGPKISAYAAKGNPAAYELPRPMLHEASCDLSFSGLKTAVRYLWEGMSPEQRADEQVLADVCASLQAAIVDVTVEKAIRAAKLGKAKAVSLVGGVSANRLLQERLRAAVAERLPGVVFLDPPKGLHTDNAAMIAAVGYWRMHRGNPDRWQKLDAKPEWDVSSWTHRKTT
jgi:N6-L-threonylcarbamoyladenine synthase